MLISKFDLYNAEWLDLVFENRNKAYGAYELRQHYAGTMTKVMGITFFSIAVLCGASILFKPNGPTTKTTVVDITPTVITPPPPVKAIKKIDPPAAVKNVKPQTPAVATPTTKYIPMVVKPDDLADKNPPKMDDIPNAIGPETTKGTGKGINADPDAGTGNTGTQAGTDDKVYSPGGLEFMPEPVGGAAAWGKFLNKNLRFPPAAREDGISGRVILSFIIEKDGSLSNIVMDQPAGHGFDEEALRVLKLAKAWKPGMQNGQPVRVKYSIPINFQLSEE
jgi:protein TonB